MIRIAGSEHDPGPPAMSGARYLETLESGAAPRRRARRGEQGCQHRRPAAGHRRRRLGQDQHARPSRRPPDRQRRRPRPHPAADLLAPGRGRDGAARRAHRRRRARREGRRAQPHRLVRHVPRRRRAAVAHVRQLGRAGSGLHHPRPRGLRRSHEPRAPRAGALGEGAALSAQGDVPRHLLPRRQCRRAAGGACCASSSPGARSGRTSCAICSRPTSRPSRSSTCSTTTTCCSTGAS